MKCTPTPRGRSATAAVVAGATVLVSTRSGPGARGSATARMAGVVGQHRQDGVRAAGRPSPDRGPPSHLALQPRGPLPSPVPDADMRPPPGPVAPSAGLWSRPQHRHPCVHARAEPRGGSVDQAGGAKPPVVCGSEADGGGAGGEAGDDDGCAPGGGGRGDEEVAATPARAADRRW